MFDGGVGYISLNPVAETSAEELRQEIAAMKAQGDEVAHPRPAAQSRRPAGPGREGGGPVPRPEAGDRRHPRPGAGVHQGVLRRGQAGLARAADRRAGQRRHRERRRDHRRRPAGSRPRGGRRHPDVRQGAGADPVPAGRRRRAQADDRAVVHARAAGRFSAPPRTRKTRQCRPPSRPATRCPARPDKEHSDSAIRSRPIFHTDAGRVVRGGGGIVPDLVIRPDTLSAARRSSPRRSATICRSIATC